jgi:hypothetical protein
VIDTVVRDFSAIHDIWILLLLLHETGDESLHFLIYSTYCQYDFEKATKMAAFLRSFTGGVFCCPPLRVHTAKIEKTETFHDREDENNGFEYN